MRTADLIGVILTTGVGFFLIVCAVLAAIDVIGDVREWLVERRRTEHARRLAAHRRNVA